MTKIALVVLLATACAWGCSSDDASKPGTSTPVAAKPNNTIVVSAPENVPPQKDFAQKDISIPQDKPKNGEEVGILETSLGRIVVRFLPDYAPGHVMNFKNLANKKFYDGTKFHRVQPGFMIQGGDPNTKSEDRSGYGMGDPGYKIKAEFSGVRHERGIVSMARGSDQDSAGSQFFIMVATNPTLDHQYSAFGQIVEGMDVVDKIVEAPTEGEMHIVVAGKEPLLKSIRIEKWPLK